MGFSEKWNTSFISFLCDVYTKSLSFVFFLQRVYTGTWEFPFHCTWIYIFFKGKSLISSCRIVTWIFNRVNEKNICRFSLNLYLKYVRSPLSTYSRTVWESEWWIAIQFLTHITNQHYNIMFRYITYISIWTCVYSCYNHVIFCNSI